MKSLIDYSFTHKLRFKINSKSDYNSLCLFRLRNLIVGFNSQIVKQIKKEQLK